jgi:hypothetical protein
MLVNGAPPLLATLVTPAPDSLIVSRPPCARSAAIGEAENPRMSIWPRTSTEPLDTELSFVGPVSERNGELSAIAE